MAVKGYTFYATYDELAQTLDDDEQRGIFLIAINDFMFRNIDREDEIENTITRMAFIYAKSHLKHSLAQSNRKQGKTKTKPNKNRTKTKKEPNQNQKGTEPKPNENQMKTEQKQYQVQGQVQGIEEDDATHQSSSSIQAERVAVAGKPAPHSAKPVCPSCGGDLWRNTQSGRYECSACFSTYARSEVAS